MKNLSFLLTDVTLRDGLQMEKPIALDVKLQLFEKLLACKYGRLEITSFVNPKWVPQFADSSAFCSKLFSQTFPIETMAFVPNEKGLQRLVQFPIDWVSAFVAASETFNQKNVNASIQDTLKELSAIVALAHQEKRKVRVYVSTVFGCPYEGKMEPKKLHVLLKQVADLGADEIALSDTIGVGVPHQVAQVLEGVLKVYPKESIAMHLHNTYGLALSNIFEGLRFGITKFDGTTGGIGGCPYAKGATGNVGTDDILYALFRTGLVKEFPDREMRAVYAQLKDMQLNLHSQLAGIAERGGSFYGFHE